MHVDVSTLSIGSISDIYLFEFQILGCTYFKLDNVDEAIHDISRAIKYDPKKQVYLDSRAMLFRAMVRLHILRDIYIYTRPFLLPEGLYSILAALSMGANVCSFIMTSSVSKIETDEELYTCTSLVLRMTFRADGTVSCYEMAI
jgi:hypothetical protein